MSGPSPADNERTDPQAVDQRPRLLLDTNVWRRLSDADEVNRLRKEAKANELEIAIAPAVVYEVLRTPDPMLRARLVKAVTRASWTRLMTEVYMECQDVLAVIRRRRPSWLVADPDLRAFYRLRADWSGGRGFWKRARDDPAAEAARVSLVEGDLMSRARSQAHRTRKEMARLQFDSIRLTGWTGRPPDIAPGWDRTPVDAWRLESVYVWWGDLVEGRSQASLDWLGPFVDRDLILRQRSSWNHLWFHEINVEEVPREWMRWAVRFLQGLRKVTRGTPGDNRLAVYGFEADGIVTGDGTFVDIMNRARLDAPKPVAYAYRLPESVDPVDTIVKGGVELELAAKE